MFNPSAGVRANVRMFLQAPTASPWSYVREPVCHVRSPAARYSRYSARVVRWLPDRKEGFPTGWAVRGAGAKIFITPLSDEFVPRLILWGHTFWAEDARVCLTQAMVRWNVKEWTLASWQGNATRSESQPTGKQSLCERMSKLRANTFDAKRCVLWALIGLPFRE